MVKFVILGFNSFQFPRNLDETRCSFVHGEEDGIESVGASCFDLEAVCALSTVLDLMPLVTIKSAFAA